MSTEDSPKLNFIEQIVSGDLAAGRCDHVVTRFPPEPNGFLHIGHAKSIWLNFGLAAAHGGRCHLRFDDTNPAKEEQRYIDAIQADIRWLGCDWGEHLHFASDYFDQLYEWAVALINAGHAYVDDQTADEMRANRGSLTEPGKPSPFRDRPPEENLDLFQRMKAGEFPDGARTLRAKIDMASPNMNMRDPAMYRILHATHPRTGDAWCIYPMYDWAHGQSDWIEGVTHSVCTLEFEIHRPLYDWFIDTLTSIGCAPEGNTSGGGGRPRQYEFNRLNLSHTVMSKRKLRALVDDNHVAGWDDPRMPTLSGMRRRGYPPAAITKFCADVGLSKRNQQIELARLEGAVREELNKSANRVMAVLDPIKLVITNYPEDRTEQMDAVNNPEDESAGSRSVPFSRELYIERDDFMEDPPKKFFRLGPGREVRLRYAYWVTCTDFVKDDAGHITEIHCTYDPLTKGGNNPPPDAEGKTRKVKGTLHWVSAQHAIDTEVRLYDTLAAQPDPENVEENQTFLDTLNPDSLKTITAKAEPAITTATPGTRVQFERLGYFCMDPDSTPGAPVFNKTTGLRDTWAKKNK